ncbi:putative tail sheath protein [Campylobacter phage F336]|uniref:Putative tail sheath protein n=1 Tax=Campylobacter phage F336 TaxID=2794361 RepID=A0A7T3KDA5_9CAUD|nr:putative tail sheath protein [Campylobacter phage F336]
MALLSPGVEVKEIDLSLTVSSASSSFGAFCGIFPKGPCDGAVFINDIPTLESVFGKPTNSNYNDFFKRIVF